VGSFNLEVASFFIQTLTKTAEACGVSERTVIRIPVEENKQKEKETQTVCSSFTFSKRFIRDYNMLIKLMTLMQIL
jgi:hypothetical protein